MWQLNLNEYDLWNLWFVIWFQNKKNDFHAKIVIDGVYKVLDNVDTSYRYSLEYWAVRGQCCEPYEVMDKFRLVGGKESIATSNQMMV